MQNLWVMEREDCRSPRRWRDDQAPSGMEIVPNEQDCSIRAACKFYEAYQSWLQLCSLKICIDLR